MSEQQEMWRKVKHGIAGVDEWWWIQEGERFIGTASREADANRILANRTRVARLETAMEKIRALAAGASALYREAGMLSVAEDFGDLRAEIDAALTANTPGLDPA